MRAILFIVLSMLPASSLLAADAPSVASLGPDESLVVKFSSTGCFHHVTEIITITPGEASFAEVQTQWSDEGHRVESGPKPIGATPLSEQDITKLDALFQFYASKPDGGCTTVDQIGVSHMKGDEVVATYEFVDGSCATYRMDSVLTFGALARRLDQQKP